MKSFFHALTHKITINPSGLLSSILLGVVLVIYTYAVYVIVVGLGTFPFSQTPTNSLLPSSDQWHLNLITLLFLSLTFVPLSRWLQGYINDLVDAQDGLVQLGVSKGTVNRARFRPIDSVFAGHTRLNLADQQNLSLSLTVSLFTPRSTSGNQWTESYGEIGNYRPISHHCVSKTFKCGDKPLVRHYLRP